MSFKRKSWIKTTKECVTFYSDLYFYIDDYYFNEDDVRMYKGFIVDPDTYEPIEERFKYRDIGRKGFKYLTQLEVLILGLNDII